MVEFIYLDHAATTPAYTGVVKAMQKALQEVFGNPSSPHSFGLEAERLVNRSRTAVAESIGAEPGEIYFTSGGTEADNLAIRGTLQAKRRQGSHVIASAVEHDAVLETLRHLQELGVCEYTLIVPDGEGLISPKAVAAAVREDTVLVTVMLINNEVGTIQPVEEVVNRVKAENPEIYCHSDAAQALGKMSFRVNDLGVDLLTLSGHKLGGPKGVGSLFCRKGVRLISQNTGGGQENGLRSGTENVPAIAGFGEAVTTAVGDMRLNLENWRRCQSHLMELVKIIPDTAVHGTPLTMAPHIVNMGFPGIRGEILVHALAEKGIFVSTGAACSSRKQITSHVLDAMGVVPLLAEGSIRISFGAETTVEEIDILAGLLKQTVGELRSFQRN